MKPKRVRTGRKNPTKAHDRERVARAKLDQIPAGLWREMRLDYPAEVRRKGDAQAARGVLSLADVQALEVAEHAYIWTLMQLILAERHEEGAAGFSTLIKYLAARKQCRNHMRLMSMSMGPQLTANDQPVLLPEGMDEQQIIDRVKARKTDEIIV